jgi:hypothetical protein
MSHYGCEEGVMIVLRRVAASRSASILVAALLPALLIGCGGGGGENVGPDLGGTLDVTNFAIPAGTRQTVTSDLVVKATDSIDIAGTMIVKPGVSVALLSDNRLTISGSVESEGAASSAVITSRGREGGGDNFVIRAGDTQLSGTIRVDKNVYGCGHGDNAKLTLTGTLATLPGAKGKDRTDDGDAASSIEIGTAGAASVIEQKGRTCSQIAIIDIRAGSSLTAGAGGDGFDDKDGVQTGGDRTFTCTSGGKGGAIALQAVDIIGNGTVKGGEGGRGGLCSLVGPRSLDGLTPGAKGGSVTMTLGDGGNGGDVTLTGSISGTLPVASGPGRGGNAGRGFPWAGDGGPGGDGGDMAIKVGIKGASGSGAGTAPPAAFAALIQGDGGNGGDSEDPNMPGGKGGTLTITERLGRPVELNGQSYIGDDLTGALNGGFGFNGCAVVPQVKGTRGGDAGNVVSPVAIQPRKSQKGGDGGDGTQPALGGTGGSQGGNKVGADGRAGEVCSFVPPAGTQPGFLAVSFDDAQILPNLVPGDVVPLCRIRFGHLSAAEPITEETGCNSMHLHARAGSGGIVVRWQEPDLIERSIIRWGTSRPLTDKNPKKCGYGKLVVVSDCKIKAKDTNIR